MDFTLESSFVLFVFVACGLLKKLRLRLALPRPAVQGSQ